MRLIRYCASFLLVFALIATISSNAAAQSKNLPDSLRFPTAALAEGSLQHLLDSLGYSIDVANDELGIETFCAPGGLNTATMVLEVAGSAVSAKSGYYNAASHTQRYQLFGPTAVPGTTVTFTVASGINDIGFYIQPNLDGSTVYWYSETTYNTDHFDHVWVFSTGVPREYILAFEDMSSGGDTDYQDLVIKVIFDYDPPSLSGCPANVTVQCDNIPSPATVTATADCDPSPAVTMTETTTPGSCPQAYTITRTWTATDQWGGTASCSQVITVVDTTPPVLAGCPTDVTAECDAIPAAATVTATDNCDASVTVSLSETTTPGSCPQAYTLTRTWTATDDCGNTATCSQVITVVDSTPPVLAGCPADVTAQCDAIPAAATVTATDNCDASVTVSLSETTTPGSCPQAYTLTRTWTATDDCGNTATCSQVITVVDTTPPVLVGCPVDVTAQCDAIPAAATVTATDNCDASVTVSLSETTTPGSCPQAYTLTRTWTATDGCGNTATCSQVITVVDTTPPVLAGCPADATVQCDAVPTAATVTATDNCDSDPVVTMSETTTPGSCPQAYILTRTWTATDDCGNTATCSQVITVVDTTPPVLAGCPADVTAQCDAIPAAATVTATDNCDASVTVSLSETTTPGSCPQAYTLTRTWTATDDCGNTATCSQVITVVDNVAPVMTCPGPVTVQCMADVPAPNTASVAVSDNCDPAPVVTFVSDVPSGTTCPKVITRTYKAIDACGNYSLCTQTITVNDNTAPVLAGCPADATVQCNAVPAAATVTATDNCDSDPVVTMTETTTPGSCPQAYTLTRTWTATDDCGNTATCSQVITVVDTTPPVLAGCPADVTAQCDAIPVAATVTATDNCDASVTVSLSETTTPGSCPQAYTLTRTWTATDDCGNTASCSQVITVIDNIAPVLTCPGPVSVQCMADVPAPNTVGVVVSDNCDPSPVVTFVSDVPSGTTCPKVITRTYKAIDACGNYSLCTQTITVNDNTAPVLAGCPADATVQCNAVPAAATVTATDNCDSDPVVTMTETTTPGSCPQAYTLTRTWTATDDCGNTASCSQIITVVDDEAPVVTCPGPVTVQCMTDVPVFNIASVTVSDNCDPSPLVTHVSDVPSGGSCPLTITRTYKATDACGNEATCTQTITVNDNTPPVLVGCAADVAAECDEIPDPATVTANDNCDPYPVVTMAETTTAGSCVASYTLTRTWTATDNCGNTASCSQDITVSDNTPPVITCPPTVTVECMAEVPDPDVNLLTVTDNCDASPSLLFVSDSYDGNTCSGTITRTYRAMDDCGNWSVCQQTITIEDHTAPELNGCPTDMTISCDEAVPTPDPVTATDNCGSATVTFAEVSAPGACPQSYSLTRTWTATDPCGNTATCSQVISVVDDEAPAVTCPGSLTVQCVIDVPAPNTASVGVSDKCDPAPVVVFVSDVPSGGSCPLTITRTYKATDACGNEATCTQTITVDDDTPPVLAGCPPDVAVPCDNVPAAATVTATDNCDVDPVVTMTETNTPGSCPQSYTLTRTWTAVDDCGNTASCSQTITVSDVTAPVCLLPDDADYDFCTPTQICLPVSAVDNCDAAPTCSVVSGPGTISNGQWCYTPTVGGSWDITVSCTDECGNTCEGMFNVTATVNRPPSITNCPSADVTVHWGQPYSIDINATDPDAGQALTYSLCSGAPQGLTINSGTGVINWPTLARDICDGDVCVIVKDPCGIADTCGFHVNVVNDPPVINCLDDQSICYGYEFASQITATDQDHGPYGPWFFLISGPTGLSVDVSSGAIEWPDPTPGSHDICILATDSAHVCDYSPANADTCCFTLNVVALDVVIEKIPKQIQGQYTNVGIDFKYEDVNWPIGGFDFLIQYDPSALCFIMATEGDFITDCAWEYFTYRFGPNGNCGLSACPSGVLRIVALAETTGGNVANHPDCYTNDGVPSPGPGSTTSTELALLNFLVSNDRTYQCQFLPIRFVWYDCGDNSLSSIYGDTLHISNQVFEFGGYPADDNWINITGLDNSMPTVTGAPSPECDISFKYELIRCANFYDGGIDLVCADSIDAPGDINLNGIPYEIADAVMFTNYFVNGPQAFDPHFDGSAAASDCNADGMPLTVADLVYEIRVIIGDAVPYAKSAPLAGRYHFDGGVLTVDGGLQVSAAVMTVAGSVQPELVPDGMEMRYRFDGENTRIVVSSRLDRSTIQSFTGEFLRNVTGEIISIEMATPDGVTVMAKNVPTTYTLKQNFPNPFNPTTTIEFSMPSPGPFELTIINIQGQVVDTYRGTADAPGTLRYEWNAGDRASGIYFYRLSSNDFTATRKMLLLK